MGMKKRKLLEKIFVEGFADAGQSVAHHKGLAVFIENVAPGDVVDVEVYKKRKNHLIGRPVHFHQRSKDRVQPVCEHFGTCGGCKWQHVHYNAQLKNKQQIVEDCLSRIGKTDLPVISPILGSAEIYHYRNKLEYTFSNRGWLTQEEISSGVEMERRAVGFHIPKYFDKVIDVNLCHLQHEPTNKIRNKIRDYALKENLSFYDIRGKKGFLRNLIIRTTSIGELMVILQVGHESDELLPLLRDMAESFPEITSLQYVVNDKMNETFHDLEVTLFSGREFILEEMQRYSGKGKLRFQIGPKSFFQTNSNQAMQLYTTALDFADLKGNETVYDLYTGTGTIALFASEGSSRVIGVESVEEAISDAWTNAKANNINNVEFMVDDTRSAINDELVNTFGRPDVIITDPPRAGMHPDVVARLLELRPQKIVYISCNPATQARDVALMKDHYSLNKVQPIDMFPHTSHIENVVLLELRS